MHRFAGPLALAVTALFYLYEFVARVSPSLASTQIAGSFGLDHAAFGVLTSLFFWIYAPLQILVGMLLDRFRVRRLVVPAIGVCAGGILLFTLAPNVPLAGLGRFATGLGAAFGFVSALYVVNHWFPPQRFALLSGVVNAVGMLGTAIGSVWLTALVEAEGWQDSFLEVSVAGFVLFFTAIFLLRDPPGPREMQNAPGAELDILRPVREIATTPRVWLVALVSALYYMPINVYGALWGNEELVADHGLTPVQAETAVSLLFWGMAAGSIAAGWLSDRLGHRKWLVVSGAVLMAAMFTLAIYLPTKDPVLIGVLLFLSGLFGGGQMLTFAMAKEGHPMTASGTVIAFVNMIAVSGALLFQPLLGGIVDLEGGRFGPAMLTIPGCLIAAALLATALREERHPDHR